MFLSALLIIALVIAGGIAFVIVKVLYESHRLLLWNLIALLSLIAILAWAIPFLPLFLLYHILDFYTRILDDRDKRETPIFRKLEKLKKIPHRMVHKLLVDSLEAIERLYHKGTAWAREKEYRESIRRSAKAMRKNSAKIVVDVTWDSDLARNKVVVSAWEKDSAPRKKTTIWNLDSGIVNLF